jgi:hypothetical protein
MVHYPGMIAVFADQARKVTDTDFLSPLNDWLADKCGEIRVDHELADVVSQNLPNTGSAFTKGQETLQPFLPSISLNKSSNSTVKRGCAQQLHCAAALPAQATSALHFDHCNPGVKESAGKKKGKNTTGHGNSYLARVLGNAAVSAGRTDTFLGERYRRIARRRGQEEGRRGHRPVHPVE